VAPYHVPRLYTPSTNLAICSRSVPSPFQDRHASAALPSNLCLQEQLHKHATPLNDWRTSAKLAYTTMETRGRSLHARFFLWSSLSRALSRKTGHGSEQRRRTSCGEVWQQPYLSYQNLCNFPSNSKACEAQWCGCASPNTRSRGQFPILCAFPPFFMLILCILFSSYPEFLLILCVLFFFFFLAIP